MCLSQLARTMPAVTDVSPGQLYAMLVNRDAGPRWLARVLLLRDGEYIGRRWPLAAVRELVEMRADADPRVRQRALDTCHARLEGDWADHVGAVVRVLADNGAGHAWANSAAALSAVVDSTCFEMVVRAFADASGAARDRLAAVLGLPTQGARLPAGWADDCGPVECSWCPGDGLGQWGEVIPRREPAGSCRQVAALLTVLDSEDERVRWHAGSALAQLGEGVAGALRAVSRSRSPRARHAAWAALAKIDWRELATADRQLLTRYVRTRQAAEAPTPPWHPYAWAAGWYAMPTTDQSAVLDAFDLCDPVPATMRMGLASLRDHAWPIGYPSVGRSTDVYVSPAFDGWTLVFVQTIDEEGFGDAIAPMRRCLELSRQFGATHWYAQATKTGTQFSHSGWCVHEGGQPVRYCFYNPTFFQLPAGEVLIGPTKLDDVDAATPAAGLRAWLDEHDTGSGHQPVPAGTPRFVREGEMMLNYAMFGGDDDEMLAQAMTRHEDAATEPYDPLPDWEFCVSKVAWRLSVSPESIGPHTRVEGTGVLAVPRALRDQPRHGALRALDDPPEYVALPV